MDTRRFKMLHLTQGTILMRVVCITALTTGCASIDSAVNEQAKPVPQTLQASQQATYNGPRARLAVWRFTDNTEVDWGYSPKIGQGMARQLQDALINTKRFQVVTRDLGDLEKELAFQHHTGMVSPSTAAQFGRKLGTRLVVTATITDFEDTTPSNQNHASRSRPSSGNNLLKDIAAVTLEKWANAGKTYIAVNVQAVDVQTGEIVASKQVSAEHKDTSITAAATGAALGADIHSWDTLPRGKALRDVIDQTATFLAEPGGLPNAYFTEPAFNVAEA